MRTMVLMAAKGQQYHRVFSGDPGEITSCYIAKAKFIAYIVHIV